MSCFRFIANNFGYAVERYFDGMEAAYNDVQMWDYGAIFRAMSPETKMKSSGSIRRPPWTRCCLMRNSRMLHIPKQVKPTVPLSTSNSSRLTEMPQGIDMMLGPKDLPAILEEDVRHHAGGRCYNCFGHFSLGSLNITDQ